MNSYWFTIQDSTDEPIMLAICPECHEDKKIESWFWDGDKYGYGDYDLDCYLCKKSIHKRTQ